MLLAALLLSTAALAHGAMGALPSPTLFPFDPDDTNVPAADLYPRPPVRIDPYRGPIAPGWQGGWMAYQGDLHVHSRGHAGWTREHAPLATPRVRRDTVNQTARDFGYDFLAITNHTTSWELADALAPLYQYLSAPGAPHPPELLALNGIENYLGPGHRSHFNAFNVLFHFNAESLAEWHEAIVQNFSEDPAKSTHVQLNHPPRGDPGFVLPPPSSAGPYRAVREAVELAEYTDLPTYLELLRRGFRVAPAANSDNHATFREQEWQEGYMARTPEGRWLKPSVPTPGVPREKWAGTALGGRTGLVLPGAQPFTYAAFLSALRERRVFRTTLPGASGFVVVNGRLMGSESALREGERQLDFTVWATLPPGARPWRQLEVWSPGARRPLKRLTLPAPGPEGLEQRFSLPATPGTYVVRLVGERPGAELVLAPLWLTP